VVLLLVVFLLESTTIVGLELTTLVVFITVTVIVVVVVIPFILIIIFIIVVPFLIIIFVMLQITLYFSDKVFSMDTCKCAVISNLDGIDVLLNSITVGSHSSN
jgi:hypothetical protein